MPFNTRNPIPSGDLRDLDDNARNIDTWANDKTKLSHPDRFGVERYTWHGIEQKAKLDIADAAHDAAAEAAAEATEQANSARDAAFSARDQAIAAKLAAMNAAASSGITKYAETKAILTDGVGTTYINGDVVLVFADESQSGASAIYKIEANNAVFKTLFDQTRSDLLSFTGNISADAEWSDVPAHSDPAFDVQAQALANRTEIIKSAVLSYPDYAAASAAAATLPDGQVMEIVADETRSGRRTRYVVTLGSLEFRGGSGIWSVWDFGAVGDGVADDSGAFRAAAACEGQTVLIPWTPNGYKIEGTFETKCRFIGLGKPTINLTVRGGDHRGFWLKSGSGIESVHINRGVTAGAISGEYNNAIVIGEYATTGAEYNNITVRDVWLNGVNAGFGRTTIMGIYGNSFDIDLKNIVVTGFASYACMIHWGGDFDPAEPHGTPVTRSWHPRRIKIDGVTHRNPQPDSAAGTVYISAGHDITVVGLNSDGINTPITVACGDVGGLVAQVESAGRVLRGIKFINTTIRNYVERGVMIAGNSGTRAGGTWIMSNNNTQITFDGLVVTRGSKSTSGRSLNFRLATGVEITGLVMDHEAGADPTNLLSAGYIQSCDDVKVSGKTNVPFAWEILGSANVQINTQDECLRDDYPTDALGARVIGGQATATLAAAVNIGDTSIQVTELPIDLIKNSVIIIGGQKHLLRKAVQLSAGPTSLEIYPARAAAASGASITVDRNTSGITLDGTAEGFNTGVRVMNSNSGHGEGVRIRKTYRRSGQYDANLQGARDVSFRGARFYDGGQLNTSSVANIRMTNGCVGVDIDGCTFEDNVSGTTNIRNNVYLFGDSTAVSVRGNKFHAAQTAAINHFDPTGGTMRPSISDNWYANGVTPLEPSAGVAKTMTIGEMQIGHGSAAPTTGVWRSGDFVFNQDPPAGGKLGWICVTGGTPGVWKPAGDIDA